MPLTLFESKFLLSHFCLQSPCQYTLQVGASWATYQDGAYLLKETVPFRVAKTIQIRSTLRSKASEATPIS